jgi:hypothetical protein
MDRDLQCRDRRAASHRRLLQRQLLDLQQLDGPALALGQAGDGRAQRPHVAGKVRCGRRKGFMPGLERDLAGAAAGAAPQPVGEAAPNGRRGS